MGSTSPRKPKEWHDRAGDFDRDGAYLRIIVQHSIGAPDVPSIAEALREYFQANSGPPYLSSFASSYDLRGIGWRIFPRGKELWLERRRLRHVRQADAAILERRFTIRVSVVDRVAHVYDEGGTLMRNLPAQDFLDVLTTLREESENGGEAPAKDPDQPIEPK